MELGLHTLVVDWKHCTWYEMFAVPAGSVYASGVMVILRVPAMTPPVLNVGGGAGMAANAGEQVY